MKQPTVVQVERLLRIHAQHLSNVADSIRDGEDLKVCMDMAYAHISRIHAVVDAFDVPEVLSANDLMISP